MKRVFLHIASIFMLTTVFGQNIPMSTQYMFNEYLYNAAFGGKNIQPVLNMGYRSQWVGFEGAPKVFYVSGHTTLLNKKEKKPTDFHSIGAIVTSNVFGPQTTRMFNGSYTYHKKLNKQYDVAVGSSLGLVEKSYDPRKITLPNENVVDPAVIDRYQKKYSLDGSLGGLIYTQDYYFGASVKQIFGSRTNYDLGSYEPDNKLRKHWYMMGGYDYLLNGKFLVTPSFLYKGVKGSPSQLDLNLKINYLDKVYSGFSYRTNNTISFLMGFELNRIGTVGYSFDFRNNTYLSSSHEVMVAFRFDDENRKPRHEKFKKKAPNFGY